MAGGIFINAAAKLLWRITYIGALNAAIKIQAGVRGSKARKEVEEMRQEARKKEEKKMVSSVLREVSHEMEEEMRREEEDGEINWDDPGIEVMATNLQAGYRQL